MIRYTKQLSSSLKASRLGFHCILIVAHSVLTYTSVASDSDFDICDDVVSSIETSLKAAKKYEKRRAYYSAAAKSRRDLARKVCSGSHYATSCSRLSISAQQLCGIEHTPNAKRDVDGTDKEGSEENIQTPETGKETELRQQQMRNEAANVRDDMEDVFDQLQRIEQHAGDTPTYEDEVRMSELRDLLDEYADEIEDIERKYEKVFGEPLEPAPPPLKEVLDNLFDGKS